MQNLSDLQKIRLIELIAITNTSDQPICSNTELNNFTL